MDKKKNNNYLKIWKKKKFIERRQFKLFIPTTLHTVCDLIVKQLFVGMKERKKTCEKKIEYMMAFKERQQ